MKHQKFTSVILASALACTCFASTSALAAEIPTNPASTATAQAENPTTTQTIGGLTVSNVVAVGEATTCDYYGKIIHHYNVYVGAGSRIVSDVDQSEFYMYMMNDFNDPRYELTIDKDYSCPAYHYSLEDMGIAPHPTKRTSNGKWSAGLTWELNFTARPTYFIRADVGEETYYYYFSKQDDLSAHVFTSQARKIPSANSLIYVDQHPANAELYIIRDSSYIKLEDLSKILSGTSKQFSFTWNTEKSAIELLKGQPYQASNSFSTTMVPLCKPDIAPEVAVSEKKEYTYYYHSSRYFKDNQYTSFNSYVIDGNLCLRLHEIAQALDFYLGWDSINNAVVIDTSRGYMAS